MIQETAREKGSRRWIALAIKAVLFIVVVWFVSLLFYRSIRQVDWSVLVFKPALIVLGAAVIMAASLVGSWIYRNLYRGLGSSLSKVQSFVLLTVPPLGKYLPGKVLSMAGHAAIAGSFGISLAVSGPAIVLITGLGLSGAALLGLILVMVQAHSQLGGQFVQFVLPAGFFVVLALVFLHPAIYRRVINFVLGLVKQPPLTFNLSLFSMTKFLFGFMIQLGLYISGAAIMVLGIVDIPFSTLPTIAGVSCLASVAGFLAIFAPAGIGVYEGILLMLLTPVTGAGIAGIIAILMRLAQTAADLSLAAAGLAGLHFLRSGKTG